MKNVQIIDGADNCTFSIFQATEEEFQVIFPAQGQDLEFSEELAARLGDAGWARYVTPIWERPLRKSEVIGIHGTLFFGFQAKRASFPSSKRERDWDAALNSAQRRLYRDDFIS